MPSRDIMLSQSNFSKSNPNLFKNQSIDRPIEENKSLEIEKQTKVDNGTIIMLDICGMKEGKKFEYPSFSKKNKIDHT